MKYKASIITSMFDASDYLEFLIRDVCRQTFFSECEWIVMDANYHDEDYQKVKPVSEKNENVRLVKLDEDKGVYDTWNQAIKISDSEYITNWNCDDRRAPWCLQRQIETLDENPNIDLVYNVIMETYEANETFEKNSSKNIWPCLDFSVENLYNVNSPHNCPMWRRKIHDKCGFFDTKYKTAADYDMWVRCVLNGSKFMKIDEVLSLYYRSPVGLSTKQSAMDEAVQEFYEVRSKLVR